MLGAAAQLLQGPKPAAAAAESADSAYLPSLAACRVCAYWLGSSPQTFYRLYTMLGMVLFTFRYLVYRARKWCVPCGMPCGTLLAPAWQQPRDAVTVLRRRVSRV